MLKSKMRSSDTRYKRIVFRVRYENARYSFWQYAKRSAYHSNVDTVLSATDIDIRNITREGSICTIRRHIL